MSTPKIEEKTWITRGFPGGGSMQKKWKIQFQGGHGKFDWKSRGSTSKNSISSTGGGTFFFLESALLKLFIKSNISTYKKFNV